MTRVRPLLVLLALGLATTALALPAGARPEPCVVGHTDDCVVEYVVCVTDPCPPQINLPCFERPCPVADPRQTLCEDVVCTLLDPPVVCVRDGPPCGPEP